MANHAYLLIPDGDSQRRHSLRGRETLIGRRVRMGIRLDSPEISAEHARLIGMEHYYFIEDLGSKNGTWVNGQRIRAARLQHGDTIRIGHYNLTLAIEARQSEPPHRAPHAMLYGLYGNQRGRRLPVARAATLIGHPERALACIFRDADGYRIMRVDKRPGNVLKINDTPVTQGHEMPLHDTDRIALGLNLLEFQLRA